MIERLNGLFIPFKWYYISNTIVRCSHAHAAADEYPYYWIVTPTTQIQEICIDMVPSLPSFFRLTAFNVLDMMADTHDLISKPTLVPSPHNLLKLMSTFCL